MKKNKIILDLDFDEEMEFSGIVANSIVTDPAVELEAYFYENEKFIYSDDIKYEVESVLMVPEMLIPRNAPNGRVVYHRFKREVVDKALEYFMRNGYQNILSIEHANNHINDTDKVFLKSIYQVDENTKTERYANLPDGTIIAKYKFLDKQLYKNLLENDFKGFSIEFMGTMFVDNETLIENGLSSIRELVESDKSVDDKFDELAEMVSRL